MANQFGVHTSWSAILLIGMSPPGRLCCKSLKTPGDKFPARSRNKPRSLTDVASGSLPKSPVSLSPGDEVPHMFTRKPRLQLEKFAINGAKRLLQHNRHEAAVRRVQNYVRFLRYSGREMLAVRLSHFDPNRTLANFTCPTRFRRSRWRKGQR